MDTLLSFLIALAITLFFVWRYVRKLAVKEASAGAVPAPVGPSTPCPRCGKPVLEGSQFCAACGAPLALWQVQRAAVQEGSGDSEPQGKPRPVINATLCIGCGSCVDACPETGTLALASGKAILAHPERCTGHAKCVSACPTSAILLAFGGTLQTLRVPRIDQNFETNLPGVFIVGELGGMGLIKTAINEGKMAMEQVRKRLERSGLWKPPVIEHNHDDSAAAELPAATPKAELQPAEPECYDVLVAGAGPAGLSATLAAHQSGIKYITLEQGEIASTIRNYPRHKFLMAEPIEMPLYGNLYIGDSTKESLLAVWETILANTGVRIRTNERVENIVRTNGTFTITSAKGKYSARYIVLALGKRGTPRRLGVPGEELAKVAYRLIEAESYSDADILVIGGGDSAAEAALAVSKGGRNRVTLAHRSTEFSRLRERNRQRLEEAEATGRVRILRKSEAVEIRENSVRLSVAGEERELPNDYVFILAGGISPEEFLNKTGVEIVDKVISG